jgi:transcriptional regulator with XRE-family HTH domain
MYAGQIVRSARKAANMTLAELGEQCGYSAAQVSRYERGLTRLTDITLLRAFAAVLGIPPAVLGLSAGDSPSAAESPDSPPGRRSVASLDDSGKEDPVRRRSLLLGAGLAAPATLLARVDAALAIMPAPGTRASAAGVTAMVARARDEFDDGRLTALVRRLPACSPPTVPSPTPACPAIPPPKRWPPGRSRSCCGTKDGPAWPPLSPVPPLTG